MKQKAVMWIELGLIVVLSGALLAQCISFKKIRPVVREPAAPGESTLSYSPPPPPKLQWDTVKQLARLRDLVTPKVEKITEDIYLARGFALGSVQMVITDEGLVIIDTTETQEAASKILKRFRKITDKPIRYIIYTHGHLDHVHGSPVFREKGTEVIATKDAVEFMKRDFELLKEFHARNRLNQAGRAAPEYSRKLPIESPVRGFRELGGFVWPTITFDQEYSFELGGKKFELYHTMGETPDHLMVWLPDERVLFSGDLYYQSFPNLSTPMLEPRPVREWYESVDRMVAMQPKYIVPAHTAALIGEDKVREILTNYSKAIRYVYEETVRCINQGKTVDEAVHSVRLPAELAELDYLQELYGRVDWSVRGIYAGLAGWYDGRGTDLSPLPPNIPAREVVLLAGGADKILSRAIELQGADEHQLVCELCDIVIDANPEDKLAHIIKASSLEYLGYTGGNLNMFGFYRSAAALERKAAGIKP
ncbi:MAG: alkyl/aryl-sulfatase [Deltaproteobacteria bacterium]|nr:MAG: alkyl/aryl-sulfatase [Deltaproteobacteria bacterium]